MENLVVVVLFIVFAFVKKVIEQRNKASVPTPVPEEPKRKAPSTEENGDILQPEPVREAAYNRVNKAREKIKKNISRGKAADSGELGEQIGSQEEGKKREASGKRKSASRFEEFSGGLVQGIIYSEVLGAPRARKPFPFKQVNKL